MANKQEIFESKVKTIEALKTLQSAWLQCEIAFIDNESIIGNNDFIVEQYPFQESFTDINVFEWVNNSIEQLQKDL